MIYDIVPVAKPRQTQRDKWKGRPCVLKYHAFKDECRIKKVYLPTAGAHVKFYIPMPESWSKKQKLVRDGTPHLNKPDLDNLFKALADSLFVDDSIIQDVRISKWWAREGKIEVTGS